MGRSPGFGKETADQVNKIQIWFLKKHRYFDGFKSGLITWTHGWSENKSSVSIEVSTNSESPYLRIYYTQTDNRSGEKQEFDYKVRLTTSPCNLGGKRYWFICPLTRNGKYCGRRVGVLYKGGDYFGCRHCYDLSYESKNENRRYKLYPLFGPINNDRRIEKLREEIKTPYYRGRPTRKRRQLDRLYDRMDGINMPNVYKALNM